MSSRLNLPVLAGLALALAACSQPMSWPWEEAPAKPQATPRVASPVPPRQGPQAQPKPKTTDLKAIRPVPRPGDRDEAEAPPPAMPLTLVGLSEDETADLLGRPAEEEPQPPGKVWTYRAAGCKLSVHLFPDMEKGGFYALDYTAGEGTKEACLGKVAGEARRK